VVGATVLGKANILYSIGDDCRRSMAAMLSGVSSTFKADTTTLPCSSTALTVLVLRFTNNNGAAWSKTVSPTSASRSSSTILPKHAPQDTTPRCQRHLRQPVLEVMVGKEPFIAEGRKTELWLKQSRPLSVTAKCSCCVRPMYSILLPRQKVSRVRAWNYNSFRPFNLTMRRAHGYLSEVRLCHAAIRHRMRSVSKSR
jgi:hypothetical protein